MNGKPVIVAINLSKPMIFAEFEIEVPGIVAAFGVQDQAMLDLLTDMEVHLNTEGHAYDFGYGLNRNGIINDARTAKYKKAAKQKQPIF